MAYRVYSPGGNSYSEYNTAPTDLKGGTLVDTSKNPGMSEYGADAKAALSSAQTRSTQQPQIDTQGLINQLKQAQIDSSISALGKQRDAALSNLKAEKATIAPDYYNKRNAASTQSQLGAKNFAEFLAQRGQTNSGVANQGEIANGVALQGQIGGLNQQETAANTDIARRTTDVGNAYSADVASANAGANATYLQNMLAETQRQATAQAAQDQFNKSYALQLGQATGNINGTPTLAQKTFDTNQSNFQQTTAAEKTQQEWENNFKIMGFNADKAYKMAQLAISQQKANKGTGNGVTANANATTISYGKQLQEAIQSGRDIPFINSKIAELEKLDPRVDGDWLRAQVNSFPIDNWQRLPGY